jgi:predicted metalloprotease
MKRDGREESGNVEDRRGLGRKTGFAVAGGGGLIVVIICLILGVDPRQFLGDPGNAGAGAPPGAGAPADPREEQMAHFTKVVFHDTEVIWDEQFRKIGREYDKPTLVLFSGEVNSACGATDASVGPFYCPGDAKVYIDLSFYTDMERRLGAGGDFARAYVVAHEVGHHVQRLLGYPPRGDPRSRSETENERSVRLELQADYFAGVWAHYGDEKYHFLEKGDMESAINAAYQIGDDRLQKKARGTVVPEKFTHGTSKQRMKWFKQGFDTGDVKGAGQLFKLDYNEL